MGLNLANIEGREPVEVIVEIPAAGGSCRLLVDPGRYNARTEDWVLERANTAPANVVVEVLSTFVVEWDLFDGDEPIPIERNAIIEKVPFFEVQTPIYHGILEALNEGKAGQQPKRSSSGPSPSGNRQQRRSAGAASREKR